MNPNLAQLDPGTFKKLLTEDQIQQKIRELGNQIGRDYAGKSFTVI